MLDCAGWGTPPPELPFQDPPPAGALAAASALLGQLGALDPAGRITAAGRRMATLGAHPRLAAMMLAAGTPGEAALAADLAALLEERDPLRSPRRIGRYRPAAGGDRGWRSGSGPRRAVAHPARRRPVPPAPPPAQRRPGGRRSRPAAGGGLPGPHRPAARRARQLSPGRRRRRPPAARRPARRRLPAGRRRAGAQGLGAHPPGRAARPRHAAGRADHRTGGDQPRSGVGRGAGPPTPALRLAGPERPHRGRRSRGGGRRAGAGGHRRWPAAAALDRHRAPVAVPRGADARAGA
ncbi:MAG: hypothetical protein WDN25_22610 [Acetobacteraceae bacterium]